MTKWAIEWSEASPHHLVTVTGIRAAGIVEVAVDTIGIGVEPYNANNTILTNEEVSYIKWTPEQGVHSEASSQANAHHSPIPSA